MKPRVQHQEAMEFSFRAKQALEEYRYDEAFAMFKKAADLESEVAEFYFNKSNLEPTRSIIIRSAVFLNLKAGEIERALHFIYFGLLNSNDQSIINQLNNALELAVSLKEMTPEVASKEYNYLMLLRQRSVYYIIEPISQTFGRSVTLEMIKDFTDGYLKSLRAYGISMYKRIENVRGEIDTTISKELDKLINPLVTNSAYGSFKFSIANDFLTRIGESKEIAQLKSQVVNKYHNEIFTNPLNDENIAAIKAKYSEDEVNEIFRPLIKIKANKTPYRVGYYDIDTLSKISIGRIVNKQRTKLLPTRQLSQEDIGELESQIIHKRSSQSGRVTKKTILREQLKSYEFDYKTLTLEPKGIMPIMLSEEIILSVAFDSEVGFTVSFDDLQIENMDIEFQSSLDGFYNLLYTKIIRLKSVNDMNPQELKEVEILRKIMNLDNIVV